MTVTMAKKNPVQGVRTFYVTSEKFPDEKYMVVEIRRDGTQYYCQCNSFFCRNLPFIDTNLFSNCKHSTAVIEAIGGVK